MSDGEARAGRGGLLLGLAGFGGTTLLAQVSRLGVGLFAAGLLGPARWGFWQIVSVLLTYGALCHLGVLNAMNREVPVLTGAGKDAEAGRVQSVSLGALMVLSAICAVVGVGIGAVAAPDEFVSVVLPSVGLFLATQTAAFVLMAAKSNLRFGAVSAQQGAIALLLPLLAVPATDRFGLPGFMLGQAAAAVIACAFVFRRVPGPLRPRIDVARTRELIRIGFPILSAGVVYLFLTTTDRWIAGAMLGVEALGHYGIVALVLAGLMMVPGIVSQYVYPRMARAWGESGDPASLEAWSRRQAILSVGLLTPAVGISLLAFPAIITRWLPAYEAAVPALLVSVPVILVYPVLGGYGNVLNLLDRQKLYLAMQGIALVVNVALSIVLVSTGLGITGVAVGTTISYAVFAVAVRWAGRRACRERAGG